MLLLISSCLTGQDSAQQPPSPKNPVEDYSGMYAFLQHGAFVQDPVEAAARVTGLVSRSGDLESDRASFLEQFFKTCKLDGNKLSFTTDTVHGVSHDFKGAVEREEGKNVGDEAYYVLKGTLVQYSTDANKKTLAKSREVSFKSFPQDFGTGPEKRD